MTSMPSGSNVKIAMWGPRPSDDLCRIVGVLQKREFATVRESLLAWYEHLHTSVQHDSIPPIVRPKRMPDRKPLRHEVRVCICGDTGMAAHRFKKKLCSLLKSAAKPRRLTTLLQQGGIVCRLTRVLDDTTDACQPCGSAATDHYYHIPRVQLSPYAPHWRRPVPVGMSEHGNLVCQATDT